MEVPDWLESQFDRAVEIVQGLSKTGPVQTGYEEKLAMYSFYSLYKQATVGNVPSVRPGIWDVLGRAKWDAWAKHKNLDQREAKRLYVDTLQKVLRKYSDRTVARDLVHELDSYRTDLAAGGEYSDPEAPRSSSSSSSRAASPPTAPVYDSSGWADVGQSGMTEPYGNPSQFSEADDEMYSVPPSHMSQSARPLSSMSSQRRYRTPMTAPVGLPVSERTASPILEVPPPIPRQSMSSSYIPNTSGSSRPVSSRTSIGYGPSAAPPAAVYPAYPHPYQHMRPQAEIASSRSMSALPRPQGMIPQRPPLERALESMQASLAALHERLESIESSGTGRRASPTGAGARPSRSPNGRAPWDWGGGGLGAWSLIVSPLSKLIRAIQRAIAFVIENEAFRRSPVLAIARRLVLDISFLLFVIAIIRGVWIRSGLSRRDVKRVLFGLWRLAVGRERRPRALVDAGVQA